MHDAQVTDTEATKPGEQFHFTATLRSRELEQQYRQDQLNTHFSTARIVLAVTTFGVLVFISADYRLFGSAMPFPLILAIRLGIGALSAVVWMKLRSAVRTLTPQPFDRAFLIWGIVVGCAQVFVSFTRPASYTGHFLVHLFTVLLTYCVVPLPLQLQTIPALIMSIGMLACMTVKPPADGLTSSGLLWTLLTGNVLGFCLSRQLHRSSRSQFLALQHERAARVELEAALTELKTLRGIIPICAHCKNIRDDEGSWHQLEAYISHHSDAEFSHGICPDCVTKHFS